MSGGSASPAPAWFPRTAVVSGVANGAALEAATCDAPCTAADAASGIELGGSPAACAELRESLSPTAGGTGIAVASGRGFELDEADVIRVCNFSGDPDRPLYGRMQWPAATNPSIKPSSPGTEGQNFLVICRRI